MNSTSRRCRYIKTVDSCQNDGGLLNYLQFIYCVIPYRLIPLAMTVLVRGRECVCVRERERERYVSNASLSIVLQHTHDIVLQCTT